MSAVPTWRKYASRFWSLGISRVLLVLAAVFALLALATPIWSTQLGTSGPANDWTTTAYGWTSRTVDSYRSGAIWETRIQYYGGQASGDPALTAAVSASYLAVVVYLVLLVVITALFSLKWGNAMPRMGLLIVAALAVLVGLLALFYPIATVPNAAATDLNQAAITSFWGSTAPPPFAWGAGLGWWLLLVAVILGCLGAALPYLQHMRALPAMPSRAWPPPR